MIRQTHSVVFLLLLLCALEVYPQKVDAPAIANRVNAYKNDPKGPYKDIRWFCKDGTTRPPQERCPEPGLQRARYKDEVVALGKSNHIFLGQILATTDFSDFWDNDNYHSRIKQYLLENYLRRSNDGWILRKAKYYRGAIQAEDEENWGMEFYNWLLSDKTAVQQNFFLIRESARDIPHQGDDNKTQKIRALAKEISDSLQSFQNLRIKIHGQPGPEDLDATMKFRDSNRNSLNAYLSEKLNELILSLDQYYQPVDINALGKYLRNIPAGHDFYKSVQHILNDYSGLSPKDKVSRLSEVILKAREAINSDLSGKARLAIVDISLKTEEILVRETKSWVVATPGDLMLKINVLGKASAGCGYIERWEWETIHESIGMPATPSISLLSLNQFFLTARRLVEWSTGMFRGTFKDVVELYNPFEPLAGGFMDDRIRGTLLLPLGDCTAELGEFIGLEANLSNRVMDIRGQSQIRGLNPGVALGELAVMNEISPDAKISGDKIYVFNHPPADLKPVAGIATVSEGNMVSHVQLLARNLAIPNAVITAENMEDLKHYHGQKVFYAVSDKGTVVMKPADNMTPEEKELFETKKRNEEKIRVPIDRLDLEQKSLLNLREVNAGQSGVTCGPKAANLGQLKQMFPGLVVEGLVIPFGIFRQHMDQVMPGKDVSYWEFLEGIFNKADSMRMEGSTPEETEETVLRDLTTLREEIKSMTLLPGFLDEIAVEFDRVLDKEFGTIPVFLRSDTNMEDLKDFTGAGLNLTLFNVLDKEKIIQGIKDVWASPYTERSYKWRQRFLLNPQNVFPSILIIPAVPVDRSGVLITKGIVSGREDDLTVAFSRGAGGAVEGQAAETWLLTPDGDDILLSPSREPFYTTLPATGGTAKNSSTFEKRLLTNSHLASIKDIAEKISIRMSQLKEGNSKGPWDVELGFTGDNLWLFQIRPFVENKNAGKIDYLKSISPEIPEEKSIHLKSTF